MYQSLSGGAIGKSFKLCALIQQKRAHLRSINQLEIVDRNFDGNRLAYGRDVYNDIQLVSHTKYPAFQAG
jgi:hypothetical protein